MKEDNAIEMILIAEISKVGILKGVTPASLELDSDIKEMYNEKIRGIHGETAKKSEGKFAVFVKELNMVYSRDVCDALMMVGIVKRKEKEMWNTK